MPKRICSDRIKRAEWSDDGWFTRGMTATREDYNRAGLNALWQVALVLVVLVVAYLIGTEL